MGKIHCEVCDHPDKKEIEACLLDGGAGNSYKELHSRYNIRTTHLLKHKEKHMIQTVRELVKMCNEEYDKNMKKTGMVKKLISINVLDAFIEKYKDVLDGVTAKDVLAAIKLKEELLGHVVQKQDVKLEWLKDIPEETDEQK
jgi:hypothetical protein